MKYHPKHSAESMGADHPNEGFTKGHSKRESE